MEQKTIPVASRRAFLTAPPPAGLVEGDLHLRVPHPEDALALAAYGTEPALLEGTWVSGSAPGLDPDAWARSRIAEFRCGWEEPGGSHGATLSILRGGALVGFVYLSVEAEGLVELAYGIAPPERNRGLATRAARLTTSWALDEGGFERARLCVAESNAAGHRVAQKAGFQEVKRVLTRIEATGEAFVEVLYERES